MKNKIQKIRELLNVPKEQRIAQFIYNQHREYKNLGETGIDIFYVEDEEFIKNLEK